MRPGTASVEARRSFPSRLGSRFRRGSEVVSVEARKSLPSRLGSRFRRGSEVVSVETRKPSSLQG
ncbi:MAG: hypothetical protein LBK96_02165 [Prevotellaceae bacterium]|nr:hypothetical protein [Prevotellaceae bacterium]